MTDRIDGQRAADTFKQDPSRALVVHADGEVETVAMRTAYALINKGLAELETSYVVVFVDD
jgi:hypothetical protein